MSAGQTDPVVFRSRLLSTLRPGTWAPSAHHAEKIMVWAPGWQLDKVEPRQRVGWRLEGESLL